VSARGDRRREAGTAPASAGAPGASAAFTLHLRTVPFHLQSPGATAVGGCRTCDAQAREACEARQGKKQPPVAIGSSGGSGSGSGSGSGRGTGVSRGGGGCGAIGGGSSESDGGAAPKATEQAQDQVCFLYVGRRFRFRLVASQWLPGWLFLDKRCVCLWCAVAGQEAKHTRPTNIRPCIRFSAQPLR